MKQLKTLGIKTKEGFSVRNYKTFPSMEWGDDGGMSADIYYKGKLLGNIFQEGNGGCACLHTYGSELNADEELQSQKDLLECLKRLDTSYGENTPYSFLKNKSLSNIDDDDYEALVNNIALKRDVFKDIKKMLKTFPVIFYFEKPDYTVGYLRYKINDATEKEAIEWLEKNNIKYSNLTRYDANIDFATI